MALFHFPKNDNNWGAYTSSSQANPLLYPPEQSSKISMHKVRKVTHEHKFFQFRCWNILIYNTYFTNYTLQKLGICQKKSLHHSTIAISNYICLAGLHITHLPFTFHMNFLEHILTQSWGSIQTHKCMLHIFQILILICIWLFTRIWELD